MAIDSISSGSGSVSAPRELDSILRGNQANNQPPPRDDDNRFSSAAVTDVRQSERQALDTLRQGLSEASATGAVALAGATSVSDTLDQVGERLQRLTDPSLDQRTRATLATEIETLVGRGLETVDRSTFNGVNLLDAERDQNIEVTADRSGGTETVRDQDLRSALEGLQGLDLSTAAGARTALDGVFAEARDTTSTAIRALGDDTSRIDARIGEIQARQGELAAGDPGVDTELTADGAQQAALQIAQSLGSNTLGIVNQRPEALIGLFR